MDTDASGERYATLGIDHIGMSMRSGAVGA